MCGIFALVKLASEECFTDALFNGTEIVKHRGPDDQGFLLWDGKRTPEVYNGPGTSEESRRSHQLNSLPANTDWYVGMGHQRLSILDLSPAGHQPMIYSATGLSIAYNGEIYNYPELKDALVKVGYQFYSNTDTEVLLYAWQEWGEKCLDYLNGMFSFVVLDPAQGKLYAVRDRFGIKPLYWIKTKDYIAFASEIKQLRTLPGYQLHLNEKIVQDYLSRGLLDHSAETFDKNIYQIRGGKLGVVDLHNQEVSIHHWYRLTPDYIASKGLSERAKVEQFYSLLEDSIRKRMRSDVPLGSCLSGGLDSSSIACVVDRIIKETGSNQEQKLITSCFTDEKYDEWHFAQKVIEQTSAESYRVWPDLNKLKTDLDQLLWHMDEPFGSTSQFSQWCVFNKTAEVGLKVMLDGQGADEILAGYPGNDAALYTGLLKKMHFLNLFKEVMSFKKRYRVLPKAQLYRALQANFLFKQNHLKSLGHYLQQQLTTTSIPKLLRFEDRNSMAFSIEARVPFLDHRLVEYTLGLNEDLIYTNGVTKKVLRDSMKGILPPEVEDRKDKMGFVSPEKKWLQEEATDWFEQEINEALQIAPHLFNTQSVIHKMQDMINQKTNFDTSLWRVLCFGRWYKQVSNL